MIEADPLCKLVMDDRERPNEDEVCAEDIGEWDELRVHRSFSLYTT